MSPPRFDSKVSPPRDVLLQKPREPVVIREGKGGFKGVPRTRVEVSKAAQGPGNVRLW